MKKVLCFLATMLALVLCVAPAFSENAAEGSEATIPDNAVNVALEKEVIVEYDDSEYSVTLFSNMWFRPENLTDGLTPEVDTSNIPQDLQICMYVGVPADNRETEVYIDIDLEQLCDIYAVKLYPSNFLGGANFPSSYGVYTSADGNEWVKIGEETDLTESIHGITEPFVYPASGRAAYVRVLLTKVSCVADESTAYAGIAEVEVLGVPVPKTPKPTQEPTAEPETPSQAPDNNTEAPVSTAAPTDNTPATANNNNDNDTGKGLSTGAKVGIIIGSVVLVAAIVGIVIAVAKKKK